MGTIPTSYAPVDGNVFDVDGHNQNLYSATGSEGLYSESNGGLDSANFKSGFKLLAEHIFPFSMVYAAERRHTTTLHYYSDLMGSATGDKYISVDAVRFRLPFNANAMKLVLNFFVSPYLWFDDQGTAIHPARTQLWFDGIAKGDSEYLLPVAADGGASGMVQNYKTPGRYAIQRTHSALITDASALTRGDHEVSLRLSITNAPTVSSVWPESTMDVPRNPLLHGRVSFGAMSLVAMAFKKANT